MRKIMNTIKNAGRNLALKTAAAIGNSRGEGYVDLAVRILLAVILGALILAGLYALFGTTVLPELTRRIQEMFSYNG